MKTLGRIVIILIAAFVVIGAVYALAQTAAVSAVISQPIGSGETESRSGPPDDWANGANGQPGEMNVRPGGDHEGQGGSWEIVGRNLLCIAAIVAGVQVLESIGSRLRRKNSSTQIAAGR
jgi:hypothetical protein